MFKDPEYKDETPYELLGLRPDTPPEEVHKALALFMRDRRNIARLGKAQEALKQIKDPRERAKLDLWFYDIDAAPPAPPLDIEEFSQVPYYPPDLLDTDLESPGPAPAIRPIEYLKFEMRELRRYDGWDTSAVRPVLDS